MRSWLKVTAVNHQAGFDFWQKLPITPCQSIEIAGVKVTIKRDDLNHPIIQGNKVRKLKYNLLEAEKLGAQSIVTFGGAYSNHLLATAFAAQACGFKSVGVVRGHELANNPAVWSETLFQCKQLGMHLVFVSRSDYRLKSKSLAFKQVLENYSSHYVLPEGGSNQLALKGVAEMIPEVQQQLEDLPTHLLCPVGTGGTLAGLVQGVAQQNWQCKVLATSVLKNIQNVKNDVIQWLTAVNSLPTYEILEDFHAGGYAKNSEELIRFSVAFEQQYQIPLDKVYNSKSFYALTQLIKRGAIKVSDRPLIIHTGGLQGGVNQ